jgi:hypothetical protein
MYAQTLRKWSPIKILMYLWLSVIIILVFWCPGALTMQLTPFRSIRSDDQQISPLITSSQQQQHYRQQPHETEAQRVTEALKNQQQQHSKIFSHYSNNNYNSNRNSNNNNNNNNNHNNNNLYKKINNLKIITPNNSIRMLNHNVESGTHERIERISHSNDGENDDQRSTRTNLQHFLQSPPLPLQAKPPQPHHHQPLTNTTNNGLWLSRMNEKRVRIMAHRQHLQQMARVKQQMQQKQEPSKAVDQLSSSVDNKQHVANELLYPDYAGRNRRDSRPSSNVQQLQPLQQRPRQRRYCSARDPQTLAFAAPTVFEGKVKSMSSDRRNNFSVTFEVKEIHKKQPGYKVPQNVRLQFTSKTFKNTRECDIYREEFRLRGYVRDELEQGKVYFLFVNQIDLGNFTILGQPIKKTQKIENDVKIGVRDNYGKCDISFCSFHFFLFIL